MVAGEDGPMRLPVEGDGASVIHLLTGGDNAATLHPLTHGVPLIVRDGLSRDAWSPRPLPASRSRSPLPCGTARGLCVCRLPPWPRYETPGVDLFPGPASGGSFRRAAAPASPSMRPPVPTSTILLDRRPAPAPTAPISVAPTPHPHTILAPSSLRLRPAPPCVCVLFTFPAANHLTPTFPCSCIRAPHRPRPPQPYLGAHVCAPTSRSPGEMSRLQQP